jgi:hypothetical protein
MVGICDLLSTDHLLLHFEPPRLHYERSRLCFQPLKLLNFDLNANLDPDPAFHSNVDPDHPHPLPRQIRNPGKRPQTQECTLSYKDTLNLMSAGFRGNDSSSGSQHRHERSFKVYFIP